MFYNGILMAFRYVSLAIDIAMEMGKLGIESCFCLYFYFPGLIIGNFVRDQVPSDVYTNSPDSLSWRFPDGEFFISIQDRSDKIR